MASPDIRQNPSPEFIRKIRDKYAVERTVDKALTRKMELRNGPKHEQIDEADFRKRLNSFLAKQIEGSFLVRGFRPLTGGASKEQFLFDLDWTCSGVRYTADKLVIRRSPCEAAVTTDNLREFQVVRALEGVIPVPKAYWIDEDGIEMKRPATVYGYVKGVQKPRKGKDKVSGIGTYFPKELRRTLAEDFISHLAAIHRFDPAKAELSAFDIPSAGTTGGVIRTINWWARVWEEDRLEDIPLMIVAEQWLRANAPILDRASIVHGDYRSGNFLFDEDSARITAILDWELTYIGDRHADLAWATFAAFCTVDEPGGKSFISGLIGKDEFLDRYEELSGLRVDRERLHYFNMLELWKGIVLTVACSARVANGLKTHQNSVIGWSATLGYTLLESLRRELVKEIT